MPGKQFETEMLRYEVGPNAWIDYYPGAFAAQNNSWYESCQSELAWREESYTIFGREVLAPRLVAWHGDADAHYRYSGRSHAPEPWSPCLQAIRTQLERVSGLSFNGVLANWYRDGSDSMGWHSDREAAIGPTLADRQIASISLGARRRFLVRTEATGGKLEFAVGLGDLLVMRGRVQEHCKHALPKTRSVIGPRVNLSFRTIIL